jgi:hypothetical protein
VDPDGEWGFDDVNLSFGVDLNLSFGVDLAMGFDSDSLLYRQLTDLATDVAALPAPARHAFLVELHQAECQARQRRTLSGRRSPRRHRAKLT